MTETLTVVAYVNAFTGYGLHLIELVRWLPTLGVEPVIRPLRLKEQFGAKIPPEVSSRISYTPQPGPWELLLSPVWEKPTPGKKTVHFTMYETDHLTKVYADNVNRTEAVLVPCQWNRASFLASGVTKDIHVVPLGIDPSLFRITGRPTGKPFTFGAAGRLAHGRARKGTERVAEAFLATFPGDPNVRLEIKLHPDCQCHYERDPRVIYHKEHWPQEQVVQWLNRLDCFVSAAASEAWGFWQQQALACERALITPLHGGVLEFLSTENVLAVDWKESPATGEYHGMGNWAAINLGSLCKQMRWAYEHPDQCRELGQRAAAEARSFTWENSVRKTWEAMVQIMRNETIMLPAPAAGLEHDARLTTPRPAVRAPGRRMDTIVSLRRYGDIINLLPILRYFWTKQGYPTKLVVHDSFADILDGVSYVEPVPWSGDMEDPLSAARRLGGINAQVWGRGLKLLTHQNFATLAWEKLGCVWNRHTPLVFDRRDLAREARLADSVFHTAKPKILLKLHGISSPYREEKATRELFENEFGDLAELVDLDAIKAERIYDLLGLMDRAACLVSVDTVALWLAKACRVPVIALVHDNPVACSPPTGNVLRRVGYSQVLNRWDEIARSVHSTLFNPGSESGEAAVLVYSDHQPSDTDSVRRQNAAFATWKKWGARLVGYSGGRSSGDVGDPRRTPFIRDMIGHAISSGPENIICIANNDIKLDPALLPEVRRACLAFGCYWAYRVPAQGQPTDEGADFFAFTRAWWFMHQHQFPDLLLGYFWWDDVLARIMRWSGCPEQERLYYHEPHGGGGATRQDAPGHQHNERLAGAWLKEHWEHHKKPAQ